MGRAPEQTLEEFQQEVREWRETLSRRKLAWESNIRREQASQIERDNQEKRRILQHQRDVESTRQALLKAGPPLTGSFSEAAGYVWSEWVGYFTRPLPKSPTSPVVQATPLLGNSIELGAALDEGMYSRAMVYGGLAVLDATGLPSLARGVGRGAAWTWGKAFGRSAVKQGADDVVRIGVKETPSATKLAPQSPVSPLWPDPPAHVVRQAENVTARLHLSGRNVVPGTEHVLRTGPGERLLVDESDIMALAEWHKREISVSIVRLKDGSHRQIIGYGFALEGTPLLDQAIVTRRFGNDATLLRTIHTHPEGILRPSNADLWIALERTYGTEIIARNPRNNDIIQHQVTQQRAAKVLLNRMRASPNGPEAGTTLINPADVSTRQRQLLERVLGYLPSELTTP